MNYVEYFDPAVLLGDRLGLTLYGMFVEAYLAGNCEAEAGLYRKFIRYFRAERKEHTPENFVKLIESVRQTGMDPFRPVYANPGEYSLIQGSHRCSIAIQLGIRDVPFNLRFHDDRVDDSLFHKIFSTRELELLYSKQAEYIDRCEPDTALRCRVRSLMRRSPKSFSAPFSSKTKIPSLRTYQSLESLKISGKRPSERRFEIYELERFLRPDMTGLEIGCNVGFFTLTLARHLLQIDAFDIDPNYIALASLVKERCGAANVKFFAQSLRDYKPVVGYDFVASTAVHGWADLSFPRYLALLDRCLKPGGMLLFESHELDAEHDWPEKRAALLSRFELAGSGLIDDVDKTMYASEMREYLVLKKTAPARRVDSV